MTVTLVCDPSEATELCASQRLYLKPVAKLTISVVFPEHTGPPRALSKWEVMDKLKNMICPDQFTSVKVSKSTKGFIRFEGEVETKHLVCSLKEKLHGKMIKLNGFKDDLQVMATEEPPDFPAPQESEPVSNERQLLEEDFAEQSRDIPDCLRLEGLPCKWFALKGSESETPSEDVLRAVFEGFGKIKNIDIPMLDPYREETVGGNANSFTFRGLRTFEAYVQYQEAAAFAKAMETLKGMKLMLKGDDGKALACSIKVTSDTTNHFSESAINHRHLERLTLQGLERERKREENRAKKGAERKRRDDDDEKKVGEGKRKSKIKRREKRQIDRDEKRPRKQQKLTAGEALWPENMPEWEERKYLLAQRRVESIRLLTVLLSQIKDFVLSSRQIGEPLLSLENKREDCFSAPWIQNAPKEKADSPYFGYPDLKDENELKCLSTQLENTRVGGEEEDQYIGMDQPASPCPLGRTVNEPAARAVMSRFTDKDTDGCRGCGLLQVTVTQECKVTESPDQEDYPGLNQGHFSQAPEAGICKKQKVYETEEFIHYLLNYYQTPRYARICPVTQNTEKESWWRRVVSHSGDGFQVNLKNNEGQYLTEESFELEFPDGGSRESDNYQWEVIEEEPGPTEVMPEREHREFTKNSPGWWDDSLGETPRDAMNRSFLGSCNTARDKKSQEDNTGMEAVRSRKSLSRMYKLKDLLEEISSDSDCFSEALESRSKMEKRNGGCRSSCKAWPLSRQRARELLICVQNVARGDQEDTCSKRSFCCDLTKHPRQKLKTASKPRSSSKVRHEGHKAKWPSSDEEKEACRKKKKKSLGSSLLHGKPHFLKTNHCGELGSFGKVHRKCGKVLHHKMKCKTLHTVTGVVKTKDVIHLGSSPLQEAHPEAGKGNVGVVVTDERGPDTEGRQRVYKAGVKR